MYIYFLKKLQNKIILLFIAALLLLPFSLSYAQLDKANIDSEVTMEDTVSSIETETDTIVTYLGSPADSNSSIEYDLENKKILIFGTESKPAKVVYRGMTLEAGKITVLLDSSLLIAEGIPDNRSGEKKFSTT